MGCRPPASSLERRRRTYTSIRCWGPRRSRSPPRGDDLLLGRHLPGPANEELEHVELASVRVTSLPFSHTRRWPGSIRMSPTSTGTGLRPVPRRSRARTRADQHGEGEGLGQVVVRSGVERLGLVEITVLGRQHQDGTPVARSTQVGADLVAVPTGEEDVEDDEVVGALSCHPQPMRAVGGDLHAESLGFQAALDRSGDLHVVLDDQLHGTPLALSVAASGASSAWNLNGR